MKFCVYLEDWFYSKICVGGIKEVKMKVIVDFFFNFIIGNKEENSLEDICVLEKDYLVWMSDIEDLEDVLDMICIIGLFMDS